MKRKNILDSAKLLQISSKNSVIDVYVDAFPIEQVKLRTADYNTPQTSIDIFIDFSEFLKLAEDVRNGSLINALAQGKPITIARGGTNAQRAGRPDGKAESRTMTLGMAKDKIYFNASLGPGEATQTGLIKPVGQPDKKVSAVMSIPDFRRLFIYTEAAINAYLPTLVNGLVAAGAEAREKFNQNFQNSIPAPII